MNRGALIIVEGLDRSGKSTQCRLLGQRLNALGHKTKNLRFPDRTTSTGKIINEYLSDKDNKLDDHAVHLLFSSNRWEQVDSMLEDLNNGITLIVDRYAFSGVAYSSSKPGLSVDWCKSPDRGLPKPDMVLFFEVSEDVAKQRAEFGNERYEATDIQRSVRKKFELLFDDGYWRRVDANLTQEEVYKNAESLVLETMKNVQDKPIDKLWIE